ncbi:DAK2 domain-containing protein [Cellulomonas sp. NPDC057328]|uniref:DAK2 domain-containing protein n=1 Tax=Cellulomonas sp. NPDC057328 TaxID=3346101 RepID=UPI003625AC4D
MPGAGAGAVAGPDAAPARAAGGDGALGDPVVLRAWAAGARTACAAARERVDAVNVFPVPDADTGSNVLLTVSGGADAVAALPAGADAVAVARALATGAATAARGSSGIILSQWLVGLAAAVEAGDDLAGALTRAAVAARAAVPDPQEGTVLTVAAEVAARVGRDAAVPVGRDAAVPVGRDAAVPGAGARTAADVLADALAVARADLGRVSAGHDVLRAAHVVDAGACALLVVLDALGHALRTRTPAGAVDVDLAWLPSGAPAPGTGRTGHAAHAAHAGHAHEGHGASGGGAFEVMLLVRSGADAREASRADADALAAALRTVGDAVAVVAAGDRWHAHVHTDDPAAALALVPAAARDRVLVRAVEPGVVAGPGLVVVTASPGLAGWFATAGAVALVTGPGVPPDPAHVRRAAVDTEAATVLVLDAVGDVPAVDVPAAAASPDVPEVAVLPAGSDGAAVVACLAALADPPAAGDAARGALGRLRSVRVPGHPPGDVPALVAAVRDLVRSRPEAQAVTLVHDADAAPAAVEAASGALRDALAEQEVVVVGPSAARGWWAGVD